MKNLAATGLVSVNILEPLLDTLIESGMEKLPDDTSALLHGKYKVFLNGDWVGVCGDPQSLVAVLRYKRRRKELPSQVLFPNSSSYLCDFSYILLCKSMMYFKLIN